MTQNIYDNPEFYAGYSQLRRSVEGLDGAPEWPALRALLPDLRGLNVLDLGCGYGWFCRWAHEQGAARVLGLDVSEKMLAQARTLTTVGGITYKRADLETFDLPAASFDVAYSSLVLHYIRDVASFFAKVHRALTPGGRLVFSTEHPIYMAPSNPGWSTDSDGRETWPMHGYLTEGPRTTDWLAKGVVKHHRTIGTTLNVLIREGFAITHVEEWGPTDEQIAANPQWARERERPMFLLVAADRR
jgi:2-polyprenyl-3-methyl-5-hydroxy-6-metoxy-1,4-benzoquinol methylase